MVTISVRVPADRQRSAIFEIVAKPSMTVRGIACASADAALAKRHGNAGCDPMRPWGHPPLGRYRFIASGRLPKGSHAELGDHMLVFQPESGPALEAESFGRLLLPVYGGPKGQGGRLRRTRGGLRVEPSLLAALLYRTASEPDLRLEISELQPPAWWQFWRHAEKGLPLAGEQLADSAPPLDEFSLAQALAAGKRFAPGKSSGRSEDDDFLSSRDSDRSSSSSSGADTSYSGRGGESGGAGASGSWDAPRGVDSAGRITAAAAGIAAGAIAAGALASSDSASQEGASQDSAGGIGTDTTTSY